MLVTLPREFDLIIFSFFSFLRGKTITFSNRSSISFLFTKLLGKKNFFPVSSEKSDFRFYFISFASFEDIFKFWNGKVKISLLSDLTFRSQGWLLIYLTPLREPIRCYGSLARSPFINYFTSFEAWISLGNRGSEFIIAMKISSFLGA